MIHMIQITDGRFSVSDSPLGSPDGREDMQVRLEGMAELEADVLDTFNRFDKLGNHMDQLLAEASMMP